MLKGKFYKTCEMYGPEFWAFDGKIEYKMSLIEMRILRWMSGVTWRRQNKKRAYEKVPV